MESSIVFLYNIEKLTYLKILFDNLKQTFLFYLFFIYGMNLMLDQIMFDDELFLDQVDKRIKKDDNNPKVVTSFYLSLMLLILYQQLFPVYFNVRKPICHHKVEKVSLKKS